MESPTPTHDPAGGHDGPPASPTDRLGALIEHAAHLLPAQGPITIFVHHNTLHALEDLPFDEAVRKGAHVFGCHPYLTEDRYRAELIRGRIRVDELREVLVQDLGDRADGPVPAFGTRLHLRMVMLQYPLRGGPASELAWYVAETDALRRVREEASSAVRMQLLAETRRWALRDLRRGADPLRNGNGNGNGKVPAGLAELLGRFGESRIESWTEENWEGFALQALWRLCCDGVRDLPPHAPAPHAIRHRDLLLEAAGVDADGPVHEILIRFCAAFLDQGLAQWRLPGRDDGFYRSFLNLYRHAPALPVGWLRSLAPELSRLADSGAGPLESIAESLGILGVAEDEWGEYISATLLALRGWGGMLRQAEIRGDRVVLPVPPGTLVEFLAIRLVLDRLAVDQAAAQALDYRGPLAGLRGSLRDRISGRPDAGIEPRAFAVFQLAQVAGVSPDALYRLDPAGWACLVAEIESFTSLERRRVFHLAYERRFYAQTLDALAIHARRPPDAGGEAPPPQGPPKFQAIFCIDDREESIRRHLEELAPEAETFGTAGFFSVPMYYRGIEDAHFVPLCPPVIRPRHWVAEEPLDAGRGRSRARRALGMARHRIHTGTRTFAGGAVLSAALGVLASVPLVAGTLFPRVTSRIGGRFRRFVQDVPRTRLRLERAAAEPGQEGGGIGFSLDEMEGIAEKVLREIGLDSGFARLVLVVGHGSTSMNNPHASAYDCGACGGARGGPNARALAQILNDPRIRGRLAAKGVVIPADAHFVGAMHNTSNDGLTFFDDDLIPGTHRDAFRSAEARLLAACERNAHERCRRFRLAPLTMPFAAAKQHVEARAHDLAQVRTEWGHMTNAICVVGRRSLTRGLFLDRRAFLASYDPGRDDAPRPILDRILSAVFPVCGGISLEYYFSCVDNARWGAGTKLPHNISALLGVMDGAASDLRTGLPWQMVEFHEPVRILFVIEADPEGMLKLINRNQAAGRLCRNGWVRLATIDPATRQLSVYQEGGFLPYTPQAEALPRASSSVDWYRGWREHLDFAEIIPPAAGNEARA